MSMGVRCADLGNVTTPGIRYQCCGSCHGLNQLKEHTRHRGLGVGWEVGWGGRGWGGKGWGSRGQN